MIGSEVLAIAFGLTSAACWGSGDFSGGLATRRGSVYSVVVISQLIGAGFLIALALTSGEGIPSSGNLILGGIAGVSGAIGLVALYIGLASGRMGVVAPVAAVVTAAIPILVSFFTERAPATSQSESALLWPFVAARIASIGFLLMLTMARRGWERPARNLLPLIVLSGIFDTGGNTFFALATRMGWLDIAAVLSSLYPAATVLLAWLFLKERLMPRQWLGVVAALVALVFIA
jgi:uncharacterized membrane protein